jgi:vancomycin resistance protein YoaR
MMSRIFKFFLSITVLLLSFSYYPVMCAERDNVIVEQVSINGIDVGGLSKEDAKAKLISSLSSIEKDSLISLKYNSSTWKIKYSSIGFSYKYDEAVEKAFAIEPKDEISDQARVSETSQPDKTDISLDFTYSKESISKILDDIAKQIDKSPIDAVVKLQSGKFTISDEKEGRALDKKKALDLITQHIEKNSSETIILPVEIKKPLAKKSDLLNIKDKLGEFSTSFSVSDKDRVNNINLAAGKVSGSMLLPGQIFSFNKTVGPRVEENGFKEAHVILNNQLVSGVGGGICQVSTTLYNAVLLSNLKIVERRNHSLPSAYVALGRDATISGNYIDLKFQNNSKYPIYIQTQVKGGQIKITIYGRNTTPKRTVKISTEVLSKTNPTTKTLKDSSLKAGTVVEEIKAYPGYIVKSYRSVYENGKKISTEVLSVDKYPLVNGVKRIGTKK